MNKKEKAILVGVELSSARENSWPIEESLQEMERLAATAGAEVVAKIVQSRQKPDLKYYVGSGKVEEIHQQVHQTDADVIFIDAPITPSQQRNLEDALGVKIVDRTGLILDIFAQHAHTHEGILQVELAQMEYLLPRLTGKGRLLSRLGGGIGTRGPGETKLEMDRRRIRSRISLLKDEIEKIRKSRSVRREKRRKANIPVCSLVGYTNAGKSTLLNALTDARVGVEDKLFATLDPVLRRKRLLNGREILLADTVGFIQKLPHQLVSAFRATLEEVSEADLLLHVVDASHPRFREQIEAVYRVLEEISAIKKPIITIFNKADKIEIPERWLQEFLPSVAVSALKGVGLKELLGIVEADPLFSNPSHGFCD